MSTSSPSKFNTAKGVRPNPPRRAERSRRREVTRQVEQKYYIEGDFQTDAAVADPELIAIERLLSDVLDDIMRRVY